MASNVVQPLLFTNIVLQVTCPWTELEQSIIEYKEASEESLETSTIQGCWGGVLVESEDQKAKKPYFSLKPS